MELRPGIGKATSQDPAALAEYRALHEKLNSRPPDVEVSDYTGGGPTETIEVPPPHLDENAVVGMIKARLAELEGSTDPAAVAEATALRESLQSIEPPAPAPKPRKSAGTKSAKVEETAPGADKLEDLLNRSYGEEGELPHAQINPKGVGTTPAESPLSVEEFAKDLAKEGEKPIAEVPFSLSSEIAAQPKTVEPSLFGEERPQGAAPVRLFKSQLDAAGEGYGDIKKAKAAGEKVPEEGRRVAGRAAQRINKESFTAQNAAEKTAQIEAAKADLADPNTDPSVKAMLAAWLKENQKGIISPMATFRIAGGTAGAAVGATQTPDDPLKGAMIGGALGVATPSAIGAAIRAFQSNPNATQEGAETIGEKVKESLHTLGKMIPDWQRFSYLADTVNLPINVLIGPWGSATMAALEHGLEGVLSRDPDKVSDATRVLKVLFNPKRLGEEFRKAGAEAADDIANAEGRAEGLGQTGPAWFQRIASSPGRVMTQGDVAAKNILMEHGNFSKEQAQRATLTSEPQTPLGKGPGAFKKVGTEGGIKSATKDLMLPFYRTAVNQIEQSAERTPGLGLWVQTLKDHPDPKAAQVAQQVMGGGVGAASFILGATLPVPDNPNDARARTVRKILSNLGGQYGTIVLSGFMAGQAWQQGKGLSGSLGAAAGSVLTNSPLPTTQPLEAIKNAATGQSNKSMTDYAFEVGGLPSFMNPRKTLSVPDMLGVEPDDKRNRSKFNKPGVRYKQKKSAQ